MVSNILVRCGFWSSSSLKNDRAGANPFRVIGAIRDKLHLNAAAVQIPIGLEDQHKGLVDLVRLKAYFFDGDNGENIRVEEIPADLMDMAKEKLLLVQSSLTKI